MKTMLDIAVDLISQDTTRKFTFYEIFDEVEKNLSEKWQNEFVNPNFTYEQVRTKKMGELHRLLTVDHRFKHESGNMWKSSTYVVEK